MCVNIRLMLEMKPSFTLEQTSGDKRRRYGVKKAASTTAWQAWAGEETVEKWYFSAYFECH